MLWNIFSSNNNEKFWLFFTANSKVTGRMSGCSFFLTFAIFILGLTYVKAIQKRYAEVRGLSFFLYFRSKTYVWFPHYRKKYPVCNLLPKINKIYKIKTNSQHLATSRWFSKFILIKWIIQIESSPEIKIVSPMLMPDYVKS